ncbi:MAG TPA: hypothetical protein VJP04_02845 [Terriglobales bacterium]|nr:hypothetical protein [Terriglobales bacterium]
MAFLKKTAATIRSINQKYARPQMKMTRRVSLSLGLLRGYLLFLVAIMIYKFIVTMLHP